MAGGAGWERRLRCTGPAQPLCSHAQHRKVPSHQARRARSPFHDPASAIALPSVPIRFVPYSDPLSGQLVRIAISADPLRSLLRSTVRSARSHCHQCRTAEPATPGGDPDAPNADPDAPNADPDAPNADPDALNDEPGTSNRERSGDVTHRGTRAVAGGAGPMHRRRRSQPAPPAILGVVSCGRGTRAAGAYVRGDAKVGPSRGGRRARELREPLRHDRAGPGVLARRPPEGAWARCRRLVTRSPQPPRAWARCRRLVTRSPQPPRAWARQSRGVIKARAAGEPRIRCQPRSTAQRCTDRAGDPQPRRPPRRSRRARPSQPRPGPQADP
jgi:hypothetical protein